MKRSDELKQQRASKYDELQNLDAQAENRSFTAEEQTKFDALEAEIKDLDTQITNQENRETLLAKAAEKRAKKNPTKVIKDTPEEKAVKEYRFLRAIRSQLPNQQLEGIELEMHQEAVKEARESGVNVEGVGVPGFFFEKRDMTAGTTTTGGFSIQTDVGELIPYLRPRLLTESLGATLLTGLVGDLDIPRNDAIGTATVKGENATADETTPTLDRIQLTPYRIPAFTDVSKQLLTQSSMAVERFVRQDLEGAVRIKVDALALNGSGSSEPRGILNTVGIGDVAGGVNGGAPGHDHIVDLETEVSIDNADMGALAYLTTPGVKGFLKKTKIDAGSGIFTWAQNAREINGYRAEVSTQVPSNLTKASGSSLHAIIFGNWNELIIAQWGGIDLIVNPYTKAKEALVEIVINSYFDIGVRHPQSFAAMKDADIS